MSLHPEFDAMLTDDFLLLLDLCKDPNTVFTPESYELCIAQHWLEKLCRYDCDDLADRRLRNVYMSHLCACLIEGVLKGPFLNMPRDGKLLKADFNVEREPPVTCSVISQVHERQECLNTTPDCDHSRYEQELKNNTPSAAYLPMNEACSPPFSVEGDLQSTALPNPISNTNDNIYCGYSEPKKPNVDGNDVSNTYTPCLLNAIGAELRGEVAGGCNPYLESELERYMDHVAKLCNNPSLFNMMHSKPGMRSFLLLSLQNDLVKLINEDC